MNDLFNLVDIIEFIRDDSVPLFIREQLLLNLKDVVRNLEV